MNILFLIPRYIESKEDSTLEKELVLEFSKQGHDVYVATLFEGAENYKIGNSENINLIKINVGKYYSKGTNKYEKGITMLKIPYIFPKVLKKNITSKIECVILSTPMMNNPRLIKKLREIYGNIKIILIIWDIFPQNAIDLKMIHNKLLIKYFDNKYRKSLELVDMITVMSIGNFKYISNRYGNINKKKIIIVKNWAKLKPKFVIDKKNIREKYGYTVKDFIAVFGGNMGKPQKLENILELAHRLQEYKNIKFLFIGNGTEKERLEIITKNKLLTNVQFFNQIPRSDYEILISSCDLGIVSLDERFTVPNFPSKTTDYFKLGLPIFASLDQCSAEDYGKFLTIEAKAGVYGQAGNINDLKQKFLLLYNDQNLRQKLGNNGRYYYENNLSVEKAYDTIMNELMNLNKGV